MSTQHTVRIVPSGYSLSSTQYLSISNASNMYNNTDNTTYSTTTNSRNGTSSYYLYINGFDLSQVPTGENIIVDSFNIKLKARESGGVTSKSTTYCPALVNGTTNVKTQTSQQLSTSAITMTLFTESDLEWDDLKGYSNLGIRINCRRNNRNTTSYIYVYGAEIEVTYTELDPVVVTPTLTLKGNGAGTIEPSTATSTYETKSYSLAITPDSEDYIVSLLDNGVSVTDQLVQASGGSASSVIQEYSLYSGSFNSSGAKYFSSAAGKGYDTTTAQTGNGYSSSSSTTAVVKYTFDFSDIPSNATITSVRCRVKGHAESSSSNSEHNDCSLYVDETAISDEVSFKSTGTTNTVLDFYATTIPSRADLDNLWLHVVVGYYGGAIDGATVDIEYTVPGLTYYYNVDSLSTPDHTLTAIIAYDCLYTKINGVWRKVIKQYKNVSGTMTETDMHSTFDSTSNFSKHD